MHREEGSNRPGSGSPLLAQGRRGRPRDHSDGEVSDALVERAHGIAADRWRAHPIRYQGVTWPRKFARPDDVHTSDGSPDRGRPKFSSPSSPTRRYLNSSARTKNLRRSASSVATIPAEDGVPTPL